MMTKKYIDDLTYKVIGCSIEVHKQLGPIHDSILLTYMRMLQKPKGILINFNCVNIFKEGQKTLVNELYAALPNE